MNKVDYTKGINDIINDKHKFKELTNDPTLNREGKLQRVIRDLKKKGNIHKDDYNNVYPSGSKPALIHGLPKIEKTRSSNEIPPFRPIVSSINTFNYCLAKYLIHTLFPTFPLFRNSTLSIILIKLWFLLIFLAYLLIHAFFIRNHFIRNLHVEGRNI